jgi:RNA polymerase sigma-70 factor (ECF subfamily)
MTDYEFAVKLEMHKNTVYRLAFSYMKNVQDAEDITQDAFLKFYRCGVNFSAAENEKAWLIKITANLCKNRFRANKLRRHSALYEADGSHYMQSDIETLELLGKLSAKERAALYLFYYERYTSREIATMLGRNENTIRTWLSRGREHLRDIMTEETGLADKKGGLVYG